MRFKFYMHGVIEKQRARTPDNFEDRDQKRKKNNS